MVDTEHLRRGERIRRLKTGQVDDLPGDPTEPSRLGAQPRREAANLGGVVRSGLQRLSQQSDRTDGGLQLVADIGDEVSAHIF